MKPYYQDLHNTLYNMNFVDNDLPDESVQMVVTSPPYWGLRKYAGEQELIWGGDKGCEHEWQSKTITRISGGGDRPKDNKWPGGPTIDEPRQEGNCSLCGAWKGAYGLEPTPEMYVQHTIEILREIRRVLRKDGVVFLNLGDSYYASGGAHKPEHANPGLSKSAQRGGVPRGKQPNQSLGNVPACGNGGKEFQDWKECDCACPCHDGERQDSQLNRNADSGQQQDTDPSPPAQINHDRQHQDSALVSAGGVPHASQVSSKTSSLQSYQVNPSVHFCSDCLKFHYLASDTSNPLGTLYHIPKLKAKDLCLIPFRVALAAQSDGWWVRSDIIWSKPNPMPESVTDRPTNSHEYILMFTKSAKYYWDQEAVREPHTTEFRPTRPETSHGKEPTPSGQSNNLTYNKMHPNGRNIRSVWEFPTQPYPEAHFAVFPEKLPETCIKAATPEVGCCSKCGAPWERIVEHKSIATRPGRDMKEGVDDIRGEAYKYRFVSENKTIGWQPTCKCDADKVPSIVLDPFAGAGTTLWVAKKLNRKSIGFEISEEYCRLIVDRVRQQVLL